MIFWGRQALTERLERPYAVWKDWPKKYKMPVECFTRHYCFEIEELDEWLADVEKPLSSYHLWKAKVYKPQLQERIGKLTICKNLADLGRLYHVVPEYFQKPDAPVTEKDGLVCVDDAEFRLWIFERYGGVVEMKHDRFSVDY